MKTALLIPLLLATVPGPPSPPPERIDITGKSHVEFVGAGGVIIRVDYDKRDGNQSTTITYPSNGVKVTLRSKKDGFSGSIIERQVGDIQTDLSDTDGNGLPEHKTTWRVSAEGRSGILRTERLEWISKYDK